MIGETREIEPLGEIEQRQHLALLQGAGAAKIDIEPAGRQRDGDIERLAARGERPRQSARATAGARASPGSSSGQASIATISCERACMKPSRAAPRSKRA